MGDIRITRVPVSPVNAVARSNTNSRIDGYGVVMIMGSIRAGGGAMAIIDITGTIATVAIDATCRVGSIYGYVRC
ncbi:hypothetical protein FACS1894116_08910 [Betaproteobacteria bacterium]|nr:hypothetical protein FACS1894116_08910 [Betaproteobacteria bacterium]GHT99473.1 hypothetical protein FACS1894154_06630 [Betaproteobacteria bacterium]GHU28852.1 hypothetical protein FACS189497_05350 [Betaproteobacteria bacterium]